MSNGNSIINLGDISKPAVVLIEKISDAIGGYFKPYQIRQVARAEADAEKIKALAQIEITELQQRALHRFIFEEAKKQDNIEAITSKALPYLKEDACPNNVEDDWITNFFDKCRLISDEQMQALWAKLLAGEANSPGSYSKRTIDLLGSLDKTDASLFNTLCGFGWLIGNVVPLIYDDQASIYVDRGINFNTLEHLDDIGLISFASLSGYRRLRIPKHICIFYYGTPINIEFPGEQDNELETGKVLLTKAGQELAPFCGSEPVPDFLDYVLSKWRDKGFIVSSPYPRNLPTDKND
ncbi:DUF2806 domain-containing protein [Oscillatoria sp. FACHB-1407]|uniref:DUF2806 domain-containing protein n=1 Tax=Oscillatoria sp. FACHB-1407 TaxID=2692847 RepID=UPI001684331B|nr:DUF2806 domain-containing protein [Oscillatoria sp. FACHB-1407]MBD2464375.1 DUF2806 domain-containing protein [Oscillatoria sp. FACHB-1407]